MWPIKSLTKSTEDFSVFLILSVIGVFIYSNTFHSSFVFDDLAAIVENPAIRNLADLHTLWEAFNTRLIVGLSLALNYGIGKQDVFGYHLFNISIHILNAFLVYCFAILTLKTPAVLQRNFPDPRTLGFFAGLVFLTHPLQTEAVTYIWQRATSLATFFYLLSLVFYVRSRLQSSAKAYGVSLLAAGLGMFTKEITFTLPPAVALVEFCFFNSSKEKKNKRILLLLPFFLMLPIIPLTMAGGGGESAMRLLRPEVTPHHSMNQAVHWTHWLDITKGVEKEKIPRREYMLTQFNVLRTYLRLFFLPVNQNIDYDYPKSRSFAEPHTWISFLLLASLLVCGLKLIKKEPLAAFSILWFFLTLSVESLISQKEFIFEHRLYLPMVGFSLFLVIMTCKLFGGKNKRLMSFLLILIIFSYSILTYQRNFVWKDEVSLWSDAIRKSPNKLRPYKNRGSAYQRKGDLDQALSDFNKAIELQPDNPDNTDTYSNRASVYGMKGLLDQALADSNRAIQLSPEFAEAYNNRAILYKKKGRLDQALSNLNKAIELKPDFAIAYVNRGSVYGTKGLLNQALADYNKARELGFAVDPQLIERLKKAMEN